MKKLFTFKSFVMLAIPAILILAYLIFTRPMTLEQLHPELTPDKCTGVSGFYDTGTSAGLTEFSFEKDSQEFQNIYTLFYEQSYRRRLRDILPRDIRAHTVKPEDFSWEVHFLFEEIEDEKGNSFTGTLLQFDYWFNHELNIYYIGDSHLYRASEHEFWGKEVLNTISQEVSYGR